VWCRSLKGGLWAGDCGGVSARRAGCSYTGEGLITIIVQVIVGQCLLQEYTRGLAVASIKSHVWMNAPLLVYYVVLLHVLS
jgi:hypothetical protein